MFYAAAIYTGLCAGELAGLRWDDIDWGNRSICVKRAFDGPTKPKTCAASSIMAPLLPLLRA